MHVIEVEKLTKRFDDMTAVDGISFTVEKGEIFGFLGPNGAGKSTSINMLSTILEPSDGDALVNGFSIRRQRDDVRRSIGLVFQDPSLDDRLTAEENLRFHAMLYGVPPSEYRERVRDVLELVELGERRKHLVRTFSGGMKRRLEIARGLIHFPKVLFLDEPTIGLDPQTRAHLWQYVLKLKREKEMTIFLTTHYMNEAEYCDRIAIIDRGKIVALDTPEALKRGIGGDIIKMRSDEPDALAAEIKRRYDREPKRKGDELVLEVDDGERFMPRLFNELDAKLTGIELHEPTLDDVFLSLTGKDIRDGQADRMAQERQHMRMHPRR